MRKNRPKMPPQEQLDKMSDKDIERLLSPAQVVLIYALANRQQSESKVISKLNISAQSLWLWRTKNPAFKELFSRAERQVYEDMLKFGYASKENRVRMLARQLTKLEAMLDDVTSLKFFSRDITSEARAYAKAIAEELGQLEQKHAFTGDIIFQSNIKRDPEPEPEKSTEEQAEREDDNQ